MAPYVLYGGVAAILALDYLLEVQGGQPATISAWVRTTPARAGIAGVGIGMLIGHLFL